MVPLETLVADLALATSLAASVVLANCWGGLCGITPGSDVSSLAGFGSVFVLTPVRWALALIGLVVATAHGALHGILGTETASWTAIVGGHIVLGGLSLWWLERGLARVRAHHYVPRTFGLLGGVLLPLPVFVMACVGCNVDWAGAGPLTLASFTVAVFGVHFASWRAGRNARRLQRPAV